MRNKILMAAAAAFVLSSVGFGLLAANAAPSPAEMKKAGEKKDPAVADAAIAKDEAKDAKKQAHVAHRKAKVASHKAGIAAAADAALAKDEAKDAKRDAGAAKKQAHVAHRKAKVALHKSRTAADKADDAKEASAPQ